MQVGTMHNMKMKYLSLKNISWNWKSLFDKIVLQTITKIHKTPTFSHSMELMYISRKFSFTTYYKNSVKLSFLLKINLTEILSHTILTKISWNQRFTKEVTKELISRNIFCERQFLECNPISRIFLKHFDILIEHM